MYDMGPRTHWLREGWESRQSLRLFDCLLWSEETRRHRIKMTRDFQYYVLSKHKDLSKDGES